VSGHSAATGKPIIVFIRADDLGCTDIGAIRPKTNIDDAGRFKAIALLPDAVMFKIDAIS